MKKIQSLCIALIVTLSTAIAVFAWTNPSGNPPSGNGALYYSGTNVGIGTDPGTSKLKVAGTIESSSGGFKFPDATTQTTAYTGSGGTTNAANISAGTFGANTGGGIYDFPSAIKADTVDTRTTGDPLEINYYTSGPVKICSSVSCSTWSAYFSTNSNVGIGTSNPLSKLVVYGPGAGYVTDGYANYGISAFGSSIGVYGHGADKGLYGIGGSYGLEARGDIGAYAYGDSYDFYAGNTAGKSYFAGSVGIGTTPSYKLHVAGDIYADGGWLRTSGRSGYYSNSYGIHFYPSGASYMRLSSNYGMIFNTSTTYDSSPAGYIYHDGSNFGLLNSDGNWMLRSAYGSQDVTFSGGIYFDGSNPYINASSYFIAPGGAYFNSGTVYTEAAIQARGGISNDSNSYLTINGGTSNYTYFTGNVGIGRGDPSEMLDVYNSGTANLRLKTGGSRGSDEVKLDRGSEGKDIAGMQMYTGGTSNWFIGLPYNNGGNTPNLVIGPGYMLSSAKMIILTSGQVGIGTNTPASMLSVGGSGSASYGIYGYSASYGVYGEGVNGSGLYGHSANGYGVEGYSNNIAVLGHGGNYDFYADYNGYGPFTGAHDVILSQDFPKEVKKGMVVSVTGETKKRYDEKGEVMISTTLPTVKLSDKINGKAVFGVFANENFNGVDWYSKEAKKGERFGIINALGEGRVLVTDINGDIKAGDYITTSEIPGYGMKQNDDLLHNYTLGKITEDVDWDKITETINWNGQKYKVYLISAVYVSG